MAVGSRDVNDLRLVWQSVPLHLENKPKTPTLEQAKDIGTKDKPKTSTPRTNRRRLCAEDIHTKNKAKPSTVRTRYRHPHQDHAKGLQTKNTRQRHPH
ncbi:hypothetical protein BaRGS_00014822 [Batillaria attramentaria]|uniref:Uncharacterized protein n=1 Tax=Batillaria attramentaria TaxID=370345 RepID=A0ABD0L385_9CAEN